MGYYRGIDKPHRIVHDSVKEAVELLSIDDKDEEIIELFTTAEKASDNLFEILSNMVLERNTELKKGIS